MLFCVFKMFSAVRISLPEWLDGLKSHIPVNWDV